MKTINIKLALILMLFGSSLAALHAQVNAPGQVWQWSVSVKGAINSQGQPRAYMWIPPSCSKVRGMVLAQNNMEEFSILENQQFRDSLESIGMGEIWVSPTFMAIFNVMEGGRGIVLQMMADLATESGYAELANVPLIPMGHSATAGFPFAFSTGMPERTLCGVSISAVFPYDYGNLFVPNTQCGSTSDYIPQLITQGEFEGAGDVSTSMTKVFNRRSAHPYTPMTHLPCAGEYHFATSQDKTNFIAYYIKKSAHYRLAQEATATTLATLTPINPTTSGWLVDRWRKNMLPRYPAAPVASYTGKMSLIGSAGEENFWCFDEDMARRIETYQGRHFRKTPCLIAYNQSTTQGVVGTQVAQTNNHVQCTLAFTPLNDSLDFELSSSFLTTIPAVSGRCSGWMSTTDPTTGVVTNGVVGATIGYPADNSLSVIDREIGPLTKLRKDASTGITTFRITLERGLGATATNYQQYCIFSVAHPGDATYKASVLQADMSIPVNNTSGLAQTISFPQISNVSNATATVTLNATSSLGMPVQYFVQEGPAKIVNNKIVFTTIPQGTKLPIKVTVVAWQWGRNASLAARMTASGVPYPGQTIQTAPQVANTFYITGRLTPQIDLTLAATKVNPALIRVNWSTNTEVNNKTYEVQRSADNTNWTALGSVSASGSSLPYYVDDSSPIAGTNYYRLKITSIDGTFVYSNVVSASGGTTLNQNINTSTEINLKKVGNVIETTGFVINSAVTISVFDGYGRMVYQSNEMVPQSGMVMTNLPKLISGMYLVCAKSDRDLKAMKFIY
jgi:hypothetical protein